MINRPGAAVLSPEEASRYNDDERANLRSWGIGVPEPATFSPDEEVPIDEPIIYRHELPGRNPMIGYSTQTAMVPSQRQYAQMLESQASAYDAYIGSAYPTKGLR